MPAPRIRTCRNLCAIVLATVSIGLMAAPTQARTPIPQDPPQPEWEAFKAEFAAASTRAAEIVKWSDQERARIRSEHIAQMAGRGMVEGDSVRTWSPKHMEARFESSQALQRDRRLRMPQIADEWDQSWYVPTFAPPSVFDGVGGGGGREPGTPAPPRERVHPSQLELRLHDVRAEIDEIVIRAVTAVWHDRLTLTGLKKLDAHPEVPSGEIPVIVAEAQVRLNRLAESWKANEKYQKDAAKRAARRLEIEAQEAAILGDKSLIARIEASLSDLAPLRLECARQLIGWHDAIPRLYLAGPQASRQAHLDGLRGYVDHVLERDLTMLIDTSSGMNLDETKPHYAAPVRIRKRPAGSSQASETVTLYVRPEFDADLRKLVALHAAPGRPIGHRKTMPKTRGGKPHVFAAVVVRESLSADPIDRLLNPDKPPKPPPAEKGVTLLLLGVDLIGEAVNLRPDHSIKSDSESITYKRIRVARGIHSIGADEPLAAEFRDGLAMATRGMTLRDAWPMHLMDAVLLNVRLGPGLMPGYRTLTIGDAEAIWPLKQSSTNGFISFVRERPSRSADEADHPDEFFVFDRFCVEVETEHELETDELRIAVVHNDGPLKLRTSADESGDGVLIARKVPGFPTRLRTKPVFIEQRGGAAAAGVVEPGVHYAQMNRGDKLMATTEARLFAAPVADFAEIYLTPGELRPVTPSVPAPAGKPGEAPPVPGSLLFSEAVAQACAINEVHLPNLNLADDSVVETITHTIVFNWQRHKIEFSLLDHAAMLLMKRTFLQIADDRLRSLRTLHVDDGLVRRHIPVLTEQFRAWMRQASGAGSNLGYPLLSKSMRVAMIDGRTAYGGLTAYGRREWHPAGYPLTWAFQDSDAWWNAHFEQPEMLSVFRLKATREVLRLQIEETQRAIAHAQDADDDDMEELLELTGRGFRPVIERIVPRLMYLDSNAETQVRRWLPHERARAAVVRLGNTIAEHETAGAAAREDTEAILAVVSAVGMGAGANLVGKTILAIGSGLGAAAATQDVIKLHEDKAEVRFAANALAIIGRDRLDTGLAQREISAMPYVSAALSVLGFRFDLADAVAGVKAAQARKVAERWMPMIAREGFSALGQVPIRDKTLIYLMMKEAEEAAAAGRALNAAQQAAIDAQKRIELELAAPHPYGYPHVDAHAFRGANTEVDIKSSTPDADTAADATGDRVAANASPPVGAPAPTPAPSPASSASPPPDAKVPAVFAGAPAVRKPRRYMAIEEIPPGMPLPGYVVEAPDVAAVGAAGAAAKKYLVGQPLGKGVYATTYELLDEFGAPTGDVVKFLRRPFEESNVWMKDRLESLGEVRQGDNKHLQRLLRTQPAFDETPMPRLIDRMMHGQRLLHEARIPHLPMKSMDDPLARVGYDEDLPFVVQKRIPDDGSTIICKVEQTALPEEGMARAAADLYRKIADAGLVWKDGHAENIYFQKVGDAWMAGVLDADMIIKWEDAIDNKFLRLQVDEAFRNDRARINSLDRRDGDDPLNALDLDAPPEAFAAVEATLDASDRIHRDVAKSPQEFMAKMLEYWQWIRFHSFRRSEFEASGRIGEFIGGRIDIAAARSAFPELDEWVKRQPSQF